MTTVLQYLVIAAVIGLLLFGVALVLFGRGERMAALPARTSPAQLPDAGITGTDVRKVRFALALRGYRMSDVDWTLERLADELDRTREQLAAVTGGDPPSASDAPANADPALLVQPDQPATPTGSDQGERRAANDGPDPATDPDAARSIEMAAAAWFANARGSNVPGAAEPAGAEPVGAESTRVKSAGADPAAAEPTAAEPTAAEPAAAEPAPQGTGGVSATTGGVSAAAGGVAEPVGADSDLSDEDADRPDAPGALGPPQVPRMEN